MMNVPKLRFKDEDGREFPEWKNATFAEANIKVIDGDRGENYPNGCDFLDDGYCLFLNAKNVTKSGFVFNETSFITKQKDELLRKGKSVRGDLILTTRGTVGNVAYFDENIKYENIRINSGMVIIRAHNKEISSNYLYKYFDSPKFKKTIDQIAFGSAQPQLTVAEINKFLVKFPIPKEQTKIANFLTAIDEKISQLTQKCDLLKQYKKGVMQQIFSQKLRFKDDDGREFPEWEAVAFGDVFDFVQTNSYSREMLTYDSGTVKNIHYGDIHMKFKSSFRLEQESVPYLCSAIDISKIKPESYCKSGDIIVADASEDYTDVGKAIEVIEIGDQKLVAGLHTYIARDSNSKMFLGFGGYLMQSEDVRNQIKMLATGVSVLSISKSNLGKVKVHLPSKSEQTKIANFLTAIDDKIAQAQTQLDAVKLYKKGLLQQLFV